MSFDKCLSELKIETIKNLMDESKIEVVESWLFSEQSKFVKSLMDLDKVASKQEDKWGKGSRSSGRTIVLSNGEVFEKTAVNFSSISGESLPEAASAKRPDLKGAAFRAIGLSIVSHPRNPYVPTAHENLRLFSTTSKEKAVWWFGGGFDLTPFIGFVDDAVSWHEAAEKACRPYGDNVYSEFKAQCDDYFRVKHRSEHRGIGGLFFDDLNYWPFQNCFDFIKDVGNAFSSTYLKIVERRRNLQYGNEERSFQKYRRGRYVEFNLVHDRGTLFGLQFGGRINSILASLPPTVSWPYDVSENFKERESELLERFLVPRNWITEKSSRTIC